MLPAALALAVAALAAGAMPAAAQDAPPAEGTPTATTETAPPPPAESEGRLVDPEPSEPPADEPREHSEEAPREQRPGSELAPGGDRDEAPVGERRRRSTRGERDEPSGRLRGGPRSAEECETRFEILEDGQEPASLAGEESCAKARDRRARERRRKPRPEPEVGPPSAGFMDGFPGPSTIGGVPNFIIRKFRVPPFLLPIYQAAGIEYGIRWEVLAAINEIETDYGRNLNVSSAGALGWMQFMPATWRVYGVDANEDGRRDPYNPVDAIFAAARYLAAAGYAGDVRRAIFAYNHADWYVDSVLLRMRVIAGVPGDVIGSLTGLTEGRFPVYARARYADGLLRRAAVKRVDAGENAANLVESDEDRRGIEIFSRRGAPVVAVNDGVIQRLGRSRRLGRYVVLRDVYGNRFTYARLGEVARFHPVPRHDAERKAQRRAHAHEGGAAADRAAADPQPTGPASAGRQPAPARDGEPAAARARAGGEAAVPERAGGEAAAPERAGGEAAVPERAGGEAAAPERAGGEAAPAPPSRRSASLPVKERLFAHPGMPGAREAGGLEQLSEANARREGGYEVFDGYFARPFGADADDVRLRRLKRGSRVIGGTILGRVGRTTARAAHLYFEIRPAGKGAPRIDPKPILDGWKLLEATAIYRASGRNVLHGEDGVGGAMSVGQVMLLPKPLLEKRVLSDPRVELYECGRDDVRSGQIDRRVLATLAYLAESGLKPTVTSLKCGHGFYTSSGNVSHHSSGNAVDIAAINGVPVLGHQEPGGVTDQAVRRLLLLQGTMRPAQVISLLELGGPTLAMADHHDHIHVGFGPTTLNVFRPGQWHDLLERLGEIENPAIPPRGP